MFFATSSVYELPDIAAGLGYAWIELSPKDDFIPFFRHPRIDDAGVRRLKKVAADAGVGFASIIPLNRWSGPDEGQRQAAVRSWKRSIQIAVDLGVDVLNSEFNGRPEDPETAEAMFLRSMDELLPIVEREGIRLVLEPHPDDFIEDGLDAVGMIRGLNHPSVSFLYCTPHAFHQRHSPAAIIEAAGDLVSYVHLADAFDHTASHGLRYITNPPGNAVRVHQHMEVGRGEVDYDAVFAALAAVGFDGVISSCVFGFEEDARAISERQRDAAVSLVTQHFGADQAAALTRT
nr:sugar phosphate isomerase/epimerase family protein [Microlunatus antarcticus]